MQRVDGPGRRDSSVHRSRSRLHRLRLLYLDPRPARVRHIGSYRHSRAMFIALSHTYNPISIRPPRPPISPSQRSLSRPRSACLCHLSLLPAQATTPSADCSPKPLPLLPLFFLRRRRPSPSFSSAQAVMYDETSIDSGSCVIETSKRLCTDSRILASSSVEAKVIARPLVPKRPARPTRWR